MTLEQTALPLTAPTAARPACKCLRCCGTVRAWEHAGAQTRRCHRPNWHTLT